MNDAMKYVAVLLITVLVVVCLTTAGVQSKPKVLFIDSYHEGYAWSDGIAQGIKDVIGTKAELKIIHMDTKLCKGAKIPSGASDSQKKAALNAFMKDAALKAKSVIESWKPDVVIASDDNASKYLIEPYYKNASLPFVFCGLNWDASGYGFPCKNVTGMVEVALVPQNIDAMKSFAKGDRVGFIGGDTTTDHKEATNIEKKFNIKMKSYFADTFEDWKKDYKKLQDEVDMIIIYSTSGVKDFDLKEAQQFALQNTKVPTGCVQATETAFCLLGYTKLPEEQGEWAANAALDIINGKSPTAIPVAANKKGQLYMNMTIADKLGVKFPLKMVKQAKVARF